MTQLGFHILHHHYSWHDVVASQLREFYIAAMIRTLGLSVIGIFIPVYLYQVGYSVAEIAWFHALSYGIRIATDNVAAWLTGYFGPKHLMVTAQGFMVVLLGMLLTIESMHWSLMVVAVFNALANGFYYVAYHIEFSKIHTSKQAGKQVSVAFQLGKLAGAVGPLAGGIIAQLAGFGYVITLAIMLVLASAVPLMFGPEPVRKRQHITLKGFPWRKARRELVLNSLLGFDQVVNMFIWPLYISIFIIASDVYLNLGLVVSVGLIATVTVSRWYGRLIDSGHGQTLLRVGTYGQMLGYWLRFLVRSTTGVYIFNFLYDPIQVALRMPYSKIAYAGASAYEGYRDVYVALLLLGVNITRTATWLVVYVGARVFTDKTGLELTFLLPILTLPFIGLHTYKALK